MAVVSPNQPIHPTLDERISVKVEGQLPDFVKQDHTTFVAFLEAYYEYMEQEGKPYEIVGNLNNYANLDKTTDDFLQYFKKQFGEDVPEAIFANANKPFVLKHLRDFYRSKGSQKSFEFLFRLLYKEEIDFYLPSVDMLRASDGKYTKDKIIRTIDTSGTDAAFDLSGKTITGGTSGATALVESILKEHIGSSVVSTIFLSNVVGTFLTSETITDGTNTFILDGMVSGYTITNAGNGYTVGSSIPISYSGSASGALITIDTLTSGSITAATITAAGSGYVVGDKLTIDNIGKQNINGRTASILVKTIGGSGEITALEIENSGSGYTSIPTVSGGSGTGATITLSGSDVGGIKTLKIINNGFGYTTAPTLDFSGLGDGTATATAVVGGYGDNFNIGFTNDDGFLSSAKYIQDSRYYQSFSYEITSGQSIDGWRDIVKRVNHPAGLALFGKLQIVSAATLNLKITGVPQRLFYTIIFHHGTIAPVVADVKVDSCIGDPIPTKCQIYELDIGIQLLAIGGYEDYRFVYEVATDFEEWGLITGSVSETDNYEAIGGVAEFTNTFAQLHLGPIRRNVDRLKFKKQGGYSQETGTGTQTGSPISYFKDRQLAEFCLFDGLKTRRVSHATITQYTTDSGNAGTAQNGSATTITLASGASGDDDEYNTMSVYITSGTGVNQLRTITDYDGTTKVATVGDTWTTNPAPGSVYEVMPLPPSW
jgi:hypothetical protein